MTRRQLLNLLSSMGLATVAAGAEAASAPTRADRVELSEEKWKQRLSEPAYRVLRNEGTEPARSSGLNLRLPDPEGFRPGTFHTSA